MRGGQIWENFETTSEINPESPEGTCVYQVCVVFSADSTPLTQINLSIFALLHD